MIPQKLTASALCPPYGVYGPVNVTETTITGVMYLDMLQLWLMTQLEEHEDDIFVFQQDGALPIFCVMCASI